MDLVDVGLPGVGRVAVAVVAGIVTLGVLGTYVGAFAKLGASLGRDGDLPRWVARGAQPGGVPRRALLVVAALVAVYFALAVATGGELEPFVLVHTSCMVAIYAVGMAAAVRLLDRGSAGWWAAVVACVLRSGSPRSRGGTWWCRSGSRSWPSVAVGGLRRARVPAARCTRSASSACCGVLASKRAGSLLVHRSGRLAVPSVSGIGRFSRMRGRGSTAGAWQRRVIPAVLGVALVAGCTGGGPEPAESTTAPVAEVTPTPTATPVVKPERPAAMDEPTTDGAIAAATYFLQLYGLRVRVRGHRSPLLAMSAADCDVLLHYVDEQVRPMVERRIHERCANRSTCCDLDSTEIRAGRVVLALSCASSKGPLESVDAGRDA